jgi:hypothetical protein
MLLKLQKKLDNFYHQRSLRRWEMVVEAAQTASVGQLRQALARAWALRQHLDRLIHRAEHRLTLPAIGSNAIRRPLGTDWAWRPDIWRGPLPKVAQAGILNRTLIAGGTTIFHDCKKSELTVRQIRNNRESDIAPFALRMDVFRFDGSFLSLVLDFPPEGTAGMRQKHIIRVDMIVELEKPLEIFVRLNIKHGPNVETILREMPLDAAEMMVEFDLGYSKINERRIERVWVDLIIEGPEMNQIIFRDLTVTRRPRAEL